MDLHEYGRFGFFKLFFFYENNRNLHVKIVLQIQYLDFLYLFFLADLVICYFLWNKSVIWVL